MLPWIIQSGIISFVLIYLIHYLFTFFKNNLTVPKVIDLVNKPKEQYEDLMKNTKSTPISNEQLLPSNRPDMSNMKNELKNYLKDLKAKSPSMESGMASNIPSSMVYNSNTITPDSNSMQSGASAMPETTTISGPGTIPSASSNTSFPESANIGNANYSTF